MKVIKKVLWVLLCITIFNIVFGISAFMKFTSMMGINGKLNYTLTNEAKENLISMDDINKEIKDIKYITKDGKIDTRQIAMYIPKDKINEKIPMVYIPHYGAEEYSYDFQVYLSNGWIVAAPVFENKYNEKLTTDDLVFNNAALYYLRNNEHVDNQRILLVGGSAGGYMSLMLNELQMGTTASIANSPISNIYFNLYIHFLNCDKVNKNASLFDVPIIVQAFVSKTFRANLDDYPNKEDYDRWTYLSPIGNAKAFSNPVVINHYTADILVPIDQITKKYTYEKHDGTLPKNFTSRMGDNYPGILSHSLEEEVLQDELYIHKIELKNNVVDMEMPYDKTKLLTINVFDDGPVTAKSSHASPTTVGTLTTNEYLTEMANKGLKNTEKLIPAKLLLLLERYQGKSKQLPAHENVDDTVYGSLTIYKKEVVQELTIYKNNHSLEELDSAMIDAINSLDSSKKDAYLNAWNEIKKEME